MIELDAWLGRVAVVVSLLTYVAIRWPHGMRFQHFKVVDDRKTRQEIVLLTGAWLGTTIIPLLWVVSPLLSFADYQLLLLPWALGIGLMLIGLWVFHRSHTDLGLNWSVTVQIREEHTLVINGVYSRIRHPMYAAMTLLGIAQVLFCPNWIAGPSYLLSFGLLYLLRVRREEQMLIDQFGAPYEKYMGRTGRLLPRLGGKGT